MNCFAIRISLRNTQNFNITETHYDCLNFISEAVVLAIKIYTFHSNFINPELLKNKKIYLHIKTIMHRKAENDLIFY